MNSWRFVTKQTEQAKKSWLSAVRGGGDYSRKRKARRSGWVEVGGMV